MGGSKMDCMMCVMSPSGKIAPACALARPLRSWLLCAIWPSLSFIVAGPLKSPLHDGTLPLTLARLLPSSKGGLPSNNSQTLASGWLKSPLRVVAYTAEKGSEHASLRRLRADPSARHLRLCGGVD